MKPEEKQRLLTIEFVKILKKAEDICKQCGEEFEKIGKADNFDELHRTDLIQITSRNDALLRLIKVTEGALSTNLSLSPQNAGEIDFENIQAIQNFQREREMCYPSIDDDVQKKEYQKRDVISAKLSTLSRIEMELTHVLRKLFQTVEAIFTGKKIEKDDPNLGETRFALRVTGQSQFFSRPMTSLQDAEQALDDISTRLNKCIQSNDEEDDLRNQITV